MRQRETQESAQKQIVHYEQDGKNLMAEVITYDSDGDRYLVSPLDLQSNEQNFFIKGEKFRKLKVERK